MAGENQQRNGFDLGYHCEVPPINCLSYFMALRAWFLLMCEVTEHFL
jgi:hypothetical protein